MTREAKKLRDSAGVLAWYLVGDRELQHWCLFCKALADQNNTDFMHIVLGHRAGHVFVEWTTR